MLKIKQSLMVLLALGSGNLFAGTMGPVCSPGNITTPCDSSAWEVGGYALYLQNDVSGPLAWLSHGSERINSEWDWGFALEAGYHYNTGKDINLNWTRFYSTNNFYDQGENHIEHNWDQVNVELGQSIDVSPASKLRLHAGAQYSRLFVEGDPVSSPAFEFNGNNYSLFNSSYNGFGPRVGADLIYNFDRGLSIYGKTAGSLLIGNSKSTSSFTPLGTNYQYRSLKNIITPELEAKLGGSYSYNMNQSNLTLDAGYMWASYINVFRTTQSLYATDSSSSFSGPYFGLKYVGSV